MSVDYDAVLVVAAVMLSACGSHSTRPHGGGLGDAGEGVTSKDIPVGADMDILFVIDDSASMADKQGALATNLRSFMAALDAYVGGRPNLHIGVVSTTVDFGVAGIGLGCPSPAPGENGALQNTPRVPGCSPPAGRYIIDETNDSGGRTTNYPSSETLADAFTCIAELGTSGCELESPLEAMKRALDPMGPNAATNAGFVREGAYLAVVIVTDEDDCSVQDTAGLFGLAPAQAGPADFRCQPLYAYSCATPISSSGSGAYTGCTPRTDSYLSDPASYAQFLASVKDPLQVSVAIVAGDPGLDANGQANITTGALTSPFTQSLALEPSCTAVVGAEPLIGRPGIRLASFASNFGADHARSYSICQADYSAALSDVGSSLFNTVSPCLDGDVDTQDIDPNNPGVQLDCTLTYVENAGTAAETQQLIPACSMSDPTTVAASSSKPCWWTDMNTTDCPSPLSGWELNFVPGPYAPPDGAYLNVSCLLAPGS